MAEFDLADWFVNLPEGVEPGTPVDLDFDAWRAAAAAAETTTAMASVLPLAAPAPLVHSSLEGMSFSLNLDSPPTLPKAAEPVAVLATAAPGKSTTARAPKKAAGSRLPVSSTTTTTAPAAAPKAKRARRAVPAAAPSPAACDDGEDDFDDGASDMGESSAGSGGRKDKKSMNKAAADRYRRKKRDQFQFLQKQSAVITEENAALRQRCEQLDFQVTTLKELLLSTVRQSSAASAIARALGLQLSPPTSEQAAKDASEQSPLEAMVTQQQRAMEERLASLETRLAAASPKAQA